MMAVACFGCCTSLLYDCQLGNRIVMVLVTSGSQVKGYQE